MKAKRLLIVEDNDEFRSMVHSYLTINRLKVEIFEASTGEMGIAKASCVRPDIVIMDISLPNANGFEATKNIKEDNPKCDVIILTMFDVEAFKGLAEKVKVKEFISKSDVYERLLPAVKSCLERK